MEPSSCWGNILCQCFKYGPIYSQGIVNIYLYIAQHIANINKIGQYCFATRVVYGLL